MYISKRHQEVEEEFRKLKADERTPGVYKALCRSAKIRDTAIKNRLSALELFPNSPREREEPSDEEEPRRPKRSKPRRTRAWEAERPHAREERPREAARSDEYEDVPQ